MQKKASKIIGVILICWGVGGLLISLPSLFKKDKVPVNKYAALNAELQRTANAQRAAAAAKPMQDSVRIWRVLSKMTPKEKKPPADVAKLIGTTLEVAGFLIYNEGNADDVREFLLTPVPGGCIHVPPPPPNYIMHVLMAPGKATKFQYGPMVVKGKLELANSDLDRQNYSFEMSAVSVEPYVDSDSP